MNRDERNRLIDALLEGDISDADFLRLEAELHVDANARRDYYDRLALSASLESEAGAASPERSPTPLPGRRWLSMAAVLTGLLAVASVIQHLQPTPPNTDAPVEQRASGFAVLASQADAVWENTELADGALIPAGQLHLISGVAQVELFSGVTTVIEGEAVFEIVSPMEMSLLRGKIRAHVPEPAQGFRVRTSSGEIVDLGTEFAVAASPSHAEVHVLDGKVEWHPLSHAMRTMGKGEAMRWDATGTDTAIEADAAGFVGMAEMGAIIAVDRSARYARWQTFGDVMSRDPRLLAYYRMGTSEKWSRRLANQAQPDGRATDGAIVAAARAEDRWGISDGALDFSPTGSRVRLTVPGNTHSLTLMTWVKINSLDRWYNSLFLTDGHDLHEPHWQIMDDGRLFFSVKKNDSWDPKKGEKDKHVFYSPPFWNASLSGQWIMVATTYDTKAGKVTHFLNGNPISEETVPASYLVETVSIGAASLGNWGLPERNDPHFAVRNLNGSMDEFAIFSAALSKEEIKEIYIHGKP